MTTSTLLLLLVLLLLGAGLVAALYVRLSPMDPAVWHVDPVEAIRSGKPNDYLLGKGGDAEALQVAEPPEELLARIDAFARSQPRTVRIGGSPGDGGVSYVQRSRLMGYPDVIAVRAVPNDGGSRLTLWSRSRFGQSDFGVNRARIRRWLAELGLG